MQLTWFPCSDDPTTVLIEWVWCGVPWCCNSPTIIISYNGCTTSCWKTSNQQNYFDKISNPTAMRKCGFIWLVSTIVTWIGTCLLWHGNTYKIKGQVEAFNDTVMHFVIWKTVSKLIPSIKQFKIIKLCQTVFMCPALKLHFVGVFTDKIIA